MSKANCSQEKFEEEEVTKVNTDNQDMSEEKNMLK